MKLKAVRERPNKKRGTKMNRQEDLKAILAGVHCAQAADNNIPRLPHFPTEDARREHTNVIMLLYL